MAISGGDGSIILTTKVDTSGIGKGLTNISNATERTNRGLKSLGIGISKSLGAGDLKVIQLVNDLNKANNAVEQQIEQVERLKSKLQGLETGEIKVEDKSVSKLQGDFDKTTASIQKTQNEINALYNKLDQLKYDAFRLPSGELHLTGSEQAEVDALTQKLDLLEPKLEEDKQRADELGVALKNAIGASTQTEIEQTKQKLSTAENKLQDLSIKAEIAGDKLRTQMESAGTSTAKVGTELEKFGNRITGLIKRIFVFSVITRALHSMLNVFKTVLMSNDSFRNSLYQLQSALWVAFTPIMNYIVPVIQTLVNWLTIVTTAIAKFIGFLTGQSYSAMVDNGKALKAQTDAYKGVGAGSSKAAKGMKKVTDEAKKQLAAFDDLQILQSKEGAGDEAGGAGGGGGGGGDTGFVVQDFASGITSQLAAIMAVAGGALLAVGLLLLFSGHPLWGIGFIIAGAASLGVSVQALTSEDTVGTINSKLMAIMSIASVSLIAIGLILLFNGVWKWGISLLVAGAAILGVAIIATKNGKVDKDAETMLLNVMAIASGALLALGIILLCCGVVSAMSIGLVVAGAAGLAGTVALKPDYVKTQVAQFLRENAWLIVGVSLALLILGIVLVCVGVVTPLSIGLIVAGAVGLAAEIALNWDSIKTSITQFLQENQMLIVGISLALLILGIILCCVGFITPLSIGLIAAGAVGLATEIALNWDKIKESVKTFLKDNQDLIVGVSLALLVIGIILCVVGVTLPLGIGLISVGAVGLAAEAALNWEFVKQKVSEIFTEVYNWVKTWGLLVLGLILACSGVNLALGIALMSEGGANLTEAQDPLWETIVNNVKETWKEIKEFWNNNIAKYFTSQWWADLGKTAINGLIKKIVEGLNLLIGKLNSFGFNLPDVLGGKHIGFNIAKLGIPQLAKGAVIPANKEFLAILGDQKSGTNIEAPLDTIVDAMNIALQNRQVGNTEVVLQIDGREFGRAVIEHGNAENRRIGTTFQRVVLV